MTDDTINPADVAKPFEELAEHMGNAPVAPAHGVASIALSMAMKYHDIATIKDGVLYQQYKLEGKNLMPLHLDMVFETAIQIEKHLLGSSQRIAAMLIEAITTEVDGDDPPASEVDVTDAA